MDKKLNNRKSNSAWAKRQRRIVRQEEAIERKTARKKRTPEQQLELISSRPGHSKRETEKLLAKVN